MEKYKLCRVDYSTHSKVQPLNSEGRSVGNVLTRFSNSGDEDYYYAIYENMGTAEHPNWTEFEYFEQDFDKAFKAFNELTESADTTTGTRQKPTHELTVLGRTDCREVKQEVDKIIKELGIDIVSFEDAGRKRLAYEICGQEEANYFYYELNMNDTLPAKLSGILNIKDCVLRYLLVKTGR